MGYNNGYESGWDDGYAAGLKKGIESAVAPGSSGSNSGSSGPSPFHPSSSSPGSGDVQPGPPNYDEGETESAPEYTYTPAILLNPSAIASPSTTKLYVASSTADISTLSGVPETIDAWKATSASSNRQRLDFKLRANNSTGDTPMLTYTVPTSSANISVNDLKNFIAKAPFFDAIDSEGYSFAGLSNLPWTKTVNLMPIIPRSEGNFLVYIDRQPSSSVIESLRAVLFGSAFDDFTVTYTPMEGMDDYYSAELRCKRVDDTLSWSISGQRTHHVFDIDEDRWTETLTDGTPISMATMTINLDGDRVEWEGDWSVYSVAPASASADHLYGLAMVKEGDDADEDSYSVSMTTPSTVYFRSETSESD